MNHNLFPVCLISGSALGTRRTVCSRWTMMVHSLLFASGAKKQCRFPE